MKIADGILPASLLTEIKDIETKYSINTPLRMAHFLAQCSHESAGFTKFTENLNYSEEGLKKIFSKYFPGDLAKQYARQPEKIANRVYASRMGNGDEASGDGWKFKGRGSIQLTGKNNYASFDNEVPESILTSPDLVATKYALTSAAWFWKKNNLNAIADKGSSNEVVTEVRKKVNGGTIGLDDCIKLFNAYLPKITA